MAEMAAVECCAQKCSRWENWCLNKIGKICMNVLKEKPRVNQKRKQVAFPYFSGYWIFLGYLLNAGVKA